MAKAVREPKRHPGRPRTVDGRMVYEAIVRAAEQCIKEQGTADISATEIARTAGTVGTMINYYFGSKDHLMVLLMRRATRDMCKELRELETTVLHRGGNPTWHIVTTCASLALKHSACTRVFPVRDEQVQKECYERLETTVHAQLSRILQLLIDAGVYSPHLDFRFATFTLGALVTSSMLFSFALPLHSLTPDDLRSNAWLTHVASMLDHQFRNPRQLTADLDLEPVAASAGTESLEATKPGSRIHVRQRTRVC